jgi:hypothetical protein
VIHGTPVASAAQVTLIARLGGRPAAGGVITKDLYTYSIKILRQEKILLDHGREAVCERYRSADFVDPVEYMRDRRGGSP